MPELGVNLVGHFNAAVGLGEAARSTMRALDAAGIPYVLSNCEIGVNPLPGLEAAFTDKRPYPVDIIHLNPNWIPRFADVFEREPRRYRVGYWLWETPIFPDEWRFAFDLVDEVWTSSRFCVEAIGRVSPVPVVRIPLTVDARQPESTSSGVKIPEGKFVYLFVFDFGSGYKRKDPPAVIRSFLAAHGENDDVLLVIKSANSHLDTPGRDEIRKLIGDARNILWIDKLLPRDDIIHLMRRADCYVSLHRAEGFGLTIAEAMSLGKPVIATGYSGNMDFMTAENSFPVRYRPTAIDAGRSDIYRGKGEWAEPDEQHAADLMRYVYDYRDATREIGERAAADVRGQLNANAVGEMIKERLGLITGYFSGRDAGAPRSGEAVLYKNRVGELERQIDAMRQSRFWKMRDRWFAIKRALGLTHEE
ncbi:MAG TPA: glycosyltransferase family 4 protein [Pyrinomonadaceae bacterium]